MPNLSIAPRTTPANIQSASDVYSLADLWLVWLQKRVDAGELSKETRTTYRNGISRFIDWCDANRVQSVTNAIIMDWMADLRKRVKTGTANTWLSGLRAFTAWAVGAGHLPHDPCSGVKGATRRGAWKKRRHEMLTDAEMTRLLAYFPDTPDGKRDRALVYLMAYTAARTIEIHRANVENLKTDSGQLVLEVQGKGQLDATDIVVLSHPDVVNAVHDWLAVLGKQTGPLFTSLSNRTHGQRIALSSIRWLVKKAYSACGIVGEAKSTHSLRHTAITNAIRHGAKVQKVQQMARHADISTTMIYYHETDRIEDPAEAYISYKKDDDHA